MKIRIKNEDLKPIRDTLNAVAARIDSMEEEIAKIEREPFHADLEEECKRNNRIEILQAWIRDLSKEEDALDEVLDQLRPFIQ